jgi:hypothetical protein
MYRGVFQKNTILVCFLHEIVVQIISDITIVRMNWQIMIVNKNK